MTTHLPSEKVFYTECKEGWYGQAAWTAAVGADLECEQECWSDSFDGKVTILGCGVWGVGCGEWGVEGVRTAQPVVSGQCRAS